MCSICDRYGLTGKSLLGQSNAADTHFATGKLTTAFPADGIGDSHGTPLVPVSLIGIDTVPDTIGGNPTITVDAESTIGTLDLPGDEDYYAVQLVAGQTYEIGMYGHAGGPNALPLFDPYLELYDASGNLIVTADGGAATPRNDVNPGFDVLLSYVADYSGTYYINARAFDEVPDENNEGESVGDYELFVRTPQPDAYVPYYDPDSPLYSIDWGTQVNRVNQSQRNPDGDEGPRNTGNAAASDPVSGDAFGIPGKNVITIYFAREGDVFTSIEDPTNPGAPPVLVSVGTQQWEKDTVWTALHEFEKVADVVYVEVDTREEADFFFTTYAGTPGPGISLLGSMSPPDYPDEGLAQFNSGDYRWTEQNLQQGGFSYVTLIHEFGHGHGLAHPHDSGGHSGEMRGVEGLINTPAGGVPEPTGVYPNYTLGDHDLNQGVYTMMSYMDGWQTSPYGNAATDVGYGYLGGLMAFDIAVIQDKYGVNEEWARGNDTYTLKDANAAGTFYSSIWDAAGIDQIVYKGARDTTIDLRPATLKYEEGGGGRVSFAYGIFGGFTIAKGVTIENATSGEGNDTLIGNDASNVLTAMGGNDLLDGGGGVDAMFGGRGDDIYIVDMIGDRANEQQADGGDDTVRSSLSFTLGHYVEDLVLTGTANINGVGNMLDNSLTGNDGNNALNGAGGNDIMAGGLGNDEYWVDSVGDQVIEAAGAGTDTVRSWISYTLLANFENLALNGRDAINGTGNALNNVMTGNLAANVLDGGDGNDTLNGAGGADTLIGGFGDDVYHIDGGDTLVEAPGGGNDTVHSFFSYTLGDNFEYLVLTGSGNVGGTGNALNNVITGNAGNNLLNGKEGADSMFGGRGDDTYIVDNVGDRTTEVHADGGSDHVLSSVSFTLAPYVEKLTLTGAAATTGVGNALDNHIVGNNAANTIAGGLGADTLTGGLGNDLYIYRSADDSTAASMDRILGFHAGDRINLSQIDAIEGTAANDAFTFIGAAAFTGIAGQLRAYQSGAEWFVEADTDGDGSADLMIGVAMAGNHVMAAGDFVV